MQDLGVFIPTLDSAPHIDIVLQHYAAIGVPVTVFVDDKSSDGTLAAVSKLGVRVAEIHNPYPRIGPVIGEMSRRVGTRWVLRMDDDELPSRRMFECIAAFVDSAQPGMVLGFPRYQCAINDRGRFSFHRLHDAAEHRQWRLYRPGEVTYTPRGHTPGFEIEAQNRLVPAPADAFMVHFDWVVHSYEQRVRKIERYDADTPGHGSDWRHYYLADQLPDYRSHFSPLEAAEFDRAGAQLLARFPGASVGNGLNRD